MQSKLQTEMQRDAGTGGDGEEQLPIQPFLSEF